MRKKLFVFFTLVIFFGVTITGFVSYNFEKKLIVINAQNNLKSECELVDDYVKHYPQSSNNSDALAEEIKKRIGERVTIIAINGKVVGESDVPSEKLENHLHRPEIQQALKTGEGHSLRFSNTEKIPMFYYAKITDIGGQKYFVRLAIKLTSIREAQLQYLKLVVFAMLLGIIISAVLAYLFIDYFTKPIKSLINMATTIAMGQYEKRIFISSKDEIGQLGHAFNLMAERLKETINDLSDKRNKLFSILTSMDDGVVVLDNNEKIILINPAAKKLFNINNDVVGKYFIEVVRSHDLQDIINNISENDAEMTINYPTQKQLRIKTTSVVNYDMENESLGVLVVIQDITKIKILEKMRSDFVANVSHELKTPLTSIKGFAETLKYVDDRETKDKFLDIIYKSC